MRKKLKKLEEKRITVFATIKQFGSKKTYRGGRLPTVLLIDIKDLNGKFLTNHIWINLTKGLSNINVFIGSNIQFDARIKEYKKGYINKHIDINSLKKDYKLSHPTKFKIIK